MAAAGALSVTVHAAVLFVTVPAGSARSTGAPPAPPLQTRLIDLATPATTAPPPAVPAEATPAPTRVERQPSPEPPPVVAVTPTPDREAPRPRPLPAPPAEPEAAPQSAPVRPPAPPSTSAPVADAAPTPLPPAPALTYHGSLGLDPPPRPLTDIEQLVPEAAGLRGGTVVLRLYINEQGTVDKAEVLRSTPSGLFDATALEAASRARFSPGYLAGVPVKSQVTFEIRYRALGSGAETGGRTY